MLKKVLLSLVFLVALGVTPALAQENIELEMWTLALSPTFDDHINGVIAGTLSRA